MSQLKIEFNKLKILMRKSAKRDKIRKIRKVIKKLKEEKAVLNNNQCEQLLQDIKLLKTFKPDYITNYLFEKIISLAKECGAVTKNALSDKPREFVLLDQLSLGKCMQKDIDSFKSLYPDNWLEILMFSQCHNKKNSKKKTLNKDQNFVKQNIINTKSNTPTQDQLSHNQPFEGELKEFKKIPNTLSCDQACIKQIDLKSLLDKGCVELEIPIKNEPLSCNNNNDINDVEDSFFAFPSHTEKNSVKIDNPSKDFDRKNIFADNRIFEPITLSTAFVNSLSHKPSNNHRSKNLRFGGKSNEKKLFPQKKTILQNSAPSKRSKFIKTTPFNVKFNVKPKILSAQNLPTENLHPSWSAKKKLTKQLCVIDSKNKNKIVFSDSE